MVGRAPKPRDFALEAAQAAVLAAFQAKVHRVVPAEQLAMDGKKGSGWQRSVAKRIGVSQTVVSQLWQGKVANWRLALLLRLREWLGCSMDAALGIVPAAETPKPATVRRLRST